MQVSGIVERIEIKPETEEEKAHLQSLLDEQRLMTKPWNPLLYWGDSEAFGGAFIINSIRVPKLNGPGRA